MMEYFKLLSIFLIIHYTQSADLTCKDIRAFVDGHNNRRYKLAQGQIEGQPPASDMLAMVWDEEIANKAAQWASTYTSDLNPDHSLASHRFSIGENTAKARSSNKNDTIKIDDALELWFSENSNFMFAPVSDENFGPDLPPVGHYTQMAWAHSIYLGCAISYEQDEEYKTYYVVCGYGPNGNYDGHTPYTPGEKGKSYPLVCKTNPECEHPYGQKCIFDK